MPSQHYLDINSQLLEFIRGNVEVGVALGLPDHLGKLGDPSLAASRREIERASQIAESIDESLGENFDERLDLSLIKLYLQQWIAFDSLEINGRPRRVQKPAGVDGISAGVFQLFVNDERDASERLDNILTRLELAPDYLREELAVLDTPVRRWRDIELAQASGLPELFQSIADWARDTEFSRREELDSAISRANEGLDNYCRSLESLPVVEQFAIGREQMDTLLELKQLGKTPEALRHMAADYMAETQSQLEELRGRLLEKYGLAADTSLEALHNLLNERYAVPLKDDRLDSVLDHYLAEKDKITAWNRERQLFPVPQGQDMLIIQTPGFLEPVIPAGAMWPPLALRDGVRKSMVYLTLKADELAEHTHLGIPMMMVHEGIPGHHLQFASASLHDSLIRRLFNANEHAEGWTTMLEDYMLDEGYVDDSLLDEVRFVTKRDISRLVARVGIDLYFMSGDKRFLDVGLDLTFDSDDPFENAALLLKTATGFTDGRVQAELNWYSTEHGYPLSYLTGNRLVWELKKDIVDANQDRLPLDHLDREFHRIYLESGCMPVTSLRAIYREQGLLPAT